MSHIGEFLRRRSTTEASPRFCLAAVFVIMLWRSFASAAPMTANLRGVVRDAAGGGLPGAAVLVQRWEWEGSVKPTPRLVTMPLIYTDGEGRFSAYLPPGLYDVLVSHAVMEPVAKKIKIEPGKLATFECQVQLSILAETVKN